MGDLIPAFPVNIDISNDQRHDAALTAAEYSQDMPELAAYYLTVLGLAQETATGFAPAGTDEWELSWFTPQAGR